MVYHGKPPLITTTSRSNVPVFCHHSDEHDIHSGINLGEFEILSLYAETVKRQDPKFDKIE